MKSFSKTNGDRIEVKAKQSTVNQLLVRKSLPLLFFIIDLYLCNARISPI